MFIKIRNVLLFILVYAALWATCVGLLWDKTMFGEYLGVKGNIAAGTALFIVPVLLSLIALADENESEKGKTK